MNRLIEVEGSPFERGRLVGECFRELIRENIEHYSSFWGLDQIRVFTNSIPLIKEYDEEIFNELSGLAEGSELSMEKIIFLNSRYETLSLVPKECTSFAVSPKLSSCGHVLIGQNWDLEKEICDKDITIVVNRKDKPSYVTNTEAGVLAHKGMNSAGIGICFNALRSNLDRFGPCVPMLVILRKLYDSKSFSDVFNAIIKAQRITSANFLVAHQAGESISLEVTPGEITIVEPDEGLMLHTNHFLNCSMLKETIDKNRNNPNTHIRLMRLRSLLLRDCKIEIESIKEGLRDHFNWPESICRHDEYRTITSVIMDLNDETMLISPGSPCENKYERIPVQKYLSR